MAKKQSTPEPAFDRPPGCTCTEPHQVCEFCAGIPREQPRPSQVFTRRALDLLSTIARWTRNSAQIERRLGRVKKPEVSHTDVEEAMQNLGETGGL